MPTQPLTPDEQRTWRAFLHASTRLLAALDDELKDAHDERLTDFDVLSNLSEAPDGVLRMSDLADQTLFSRSRLTYTVGNLEARGLVNRHPDPNDGRGVIASLTDTGRAHHKKLARTHVAGIRRHFLDVMTPDERSAMTDALAAVLKELEPTPTPPL